MNVLCLLGSPRAEGNSGAIARQLCDELAGRGATISCHELATLRYSGCRNLFHCKTGGDRCGLIDDLTPILEEVREADLLVLASPIYFTDISSDLKAVIERFFSFFVPDYTSNPNKSRLAPGKQLVLVQTQGEPESAYGDLLERYGKSFRMLGIERMQLIRACGVREPGEAVGQAAVQQRLAEVVQAILPASE